MIGHNLDGSKRTEAEDFRHRDVAGLLKMFDEGKINLDDTVKSFRKDLEAYQAKTAPQAMTPTAKQEKSKKIRTIILFSGGADSIMLLLLAQKLGRKTFPIMFNYGQKHVEELEYGKRFLAKFTEANLGEAIYDYEEVTIKGAFANVASRLMGENGAKYPGVHEMHLPGRNGVFLSVALGIAESQNCTEIWIGCDFSDRLNLFPDCYQEWVVKMREVGLSNGSRKIEIKAPLLGFSKEDVLAYLQAEGIDSADVYTGYQAPSGAK